MKRILTATIAFMLIAGTADAQKREGDHQDKMAQELGLSTQQKEAIQKLREAEKQEMEALKSNGKLSKQETLAARNAIHDKYQEAFKKILTAEQQKKAAALQSSKGGHAGRTKDVVEQKAQQEGKASEKFKGRHRGAEVKEGRDKMEDELNLTADQKAKIAANREAFKTQAEAIKNNDKLSKEEKQSAFRALSEKQKAAMKEILTEEQQRKLESNRKNFMKPRK